MQMPPRMLHNLKFKMCYYLYVIYSKDIFKYISNVYITKKYVNNFIYKCIFNIRFLKKWKICAPWYKLSTVISPSVFVLGVLTSQLLASVLEFLTNHFLND